MSGRNVAIPFHIREARQNASVDLGKSETALSALARGEYNGKRTRSRESSAADAARITALLNGAPVEDEPPRGRREQWDGREDHATTDDERARIRARLERSRIVPTTTSVPCPMGHADAGEPCFSHVRGVCSERIVKVASLKAPTSGRVIGGGR